jgi:hypothetical protein
MAPSRITAANVGSMVRMQVRISAPIDAGLIYLRGVQVNGAAHDVFRRASTRPRPRRAQRRRTAASR